jgi:hypothetical protein
LERLGRYRFNHSPGESMRLVEPRWLDAATIMATLRQLPREAGAGDVYAFLDEGAASR